MLLSEPVESEAVSTRGDDRPEVIGVSLAVEIRRAGSYRVGGGLYAGSIPVSVQSEDLTQFASPEVVVSGKPGRYRVRLLFSGEDLVRARITGPLTLRVWLASERGLIDTREAEVPPLPPDQLRTLGERPAVFNRPLEVTSKQRGTSVLLKIPVQVREDGDVNVLSRLSCRGKTLAIKSTGMRLTRGEHIFELEYPEILLKELQHERSCLATFNLSWGYPPDPVDWLEIGVRPDSAGN